MEKAQTRQKLIRLIAFLIPLFSGIAYFLLPDPITLLLIAGVWAAIGLPIVNIGALYLVNKLEKELQPKKATKVILWLTLSLQLTLALLIIYSVTIGI